MSTKSAVRLVEVDEPGPKPVVVRAKIRGRTYRFTELPIGEYDKCVKSATSKQPDGLGGEEEVIDNTLLMRLLINKSADPKPSPEVGAREYRAFAKIVNDLHYGDEPIEILGDEEEEETEEGSAEGNEG